MLTICLVDLGLTENDISIINECLLATSEGLFFDEEEFHTLFGIDRSSIRNTLRKWPNVDIEIMDNRLAIHNSMVNLLGYPHGREDVWSEFLGVSPDELNKTFNRWKSASERIIGEQRHAD